MVMIAVDNFFKTIWHHRAYYLTPPFFCVCVENYIFFFCQALPQRKRRYIFLSRCINPRVGRKNSPPPTPTEKRKKNPNPHICFSV